MLLLFSLLGAVIILITTNKYGIGLTNDSLTYIISSQNFSQTFTFLNFEGSNFVEQPPLYPFVLVLLNIIPVNLYYCITIFNALLYGLLIFIAGKLIFRLTNNIKLSIITGILVIFSYTLFSIYIVAWSESIFIFLIALFLYFAVKYGKDQKKSDLIILSLIICLCTLTRYIGISVTIAYLLYLLINQNKFKNPKLVFGAIVLSCIPLIIILMINYTQTQTFFGNRLPSRFTLGDNISLTFLIISNWVIPYSDIAGFVSAATIAVTQRINNFYSKYLNNVFVIFSFVFLSLTIIISSTVAIDTLSYRLLSPVYLPLIIFFVAYVLSKLVNNKTAKVIFYIYLGCFVMFNTVKIFNKIQDSIKNGIGYNSVEIRENKLINYIKENPTDLVTYSNFAELLTLFGEKDVKLTPKEFQYNSDTKTDEYNNGDWFNSEKVILVWFDKKFRDYYMYEKDTLLLNHNPTLIEKNSYGEIYILDK